MSLPNVQREYPFDPNTAVYKNGKMFALLAEGSKPIRITLKSDPQLAKILRDKYETVLPGKNLNQKYWNTILLTGQIPNDEIIDLIRHSYEMTKED